MSSLSEIYEADRPSLRAQHPVTQMLASYEEASWQHEPGQGLIKSQLIVDLDRQRNELLDFVAQKGIDAISTRGDLQDVIQKEHERLDEFPDTPEGNELLYGELLQWIHLRHNAMELRRNAELYASIATAMDQQAYKDRTIDDLTQDEFTDMANLRRTILLPSSGQALFRTDPGVYLTEPPIEAARVEGLQIYRIPGERRMQEAIDFSSYADGILVEVIAQRLIMDYADRMGRDTIEVGNPPILLTQRADLGYKPTRYFVQPLPESLRTLVEKGIMSHSTFEFSFSQVENNENLLNGWVRTFLPDGEFNDAYKDLLIHQITIDDYREHGRSRMPIPGFEEAMRKTIQADLKKIRELMLMNVVDIAKKAPQLVHPFLKIRIQDIISFLVGNDEGRQGIFEEVPDDMPDKELTFYQLTKRYEEGPLALFAQKVEERAKAVGSLPQE